MSLESMEVSLSRHAFSARDAARAGDVWRAFQDAAVVGSTRCGWPPERYTREQCAFVVREQTVRHHRELHFGETLQGKTWVERFRRQVFTTRQIRFRVDGEPVADATQEWMHVKTDGPTMRITRASETLIACFPERSAEPLVTLPSIETPLDGPEHRFVFDAWFTWMDPLDHANHPAYVDWCDEALSRLLHASGRAPLSLRPIAERVRFKAGVLGLDAIDLRFRLVGLTPSGDAMIDFVVRRPSGKCADARLVRSMIGGPEPLISALQGER